MTERTSPEAVFADYIVPLHRFNRRQDLRYLPPGPDAALASYWDTPSTRNGGVERLSAAQCDGAALLERLGEYWTEQDQTALLRLLPALEQLWNDLFEPDSASEPSAAVPISIYPLF